MVSTPRGRCALASNSIAQLLRPESVEVEHQQYLPSPAEYLRALIPVGSVNVMINTCGFGLTTQNVNKVEAVHALNHQEHKSRDSEWPGPVSPADVAPPSQWGCI